jgi:hypothetical protein
MGLLEAAGLAVSAAALASQLSGKGPGSSSTGGGSSALAKQIAQPQLKLSEAISDPTNPLFQNLNAAEREAATKDFNLGLQAALNANIRNRAIGGPGYITVPNRRDENFWRAIATQRELGGQEAADRARKALSDAASAASGGGATAVGASNAQQAIKQSQLDRLSAGIGGLGTTLSGIESLFPNSSTQPTTGTAIGQSINNNPRTT